MDKQNDTQIFKTYDKQQLDVLSIRRKPNGEKYKSRRDMVENYKNSYLPYPLSVIFKLDYCKNLILSHLSFGVVISLPISMVLSYALNPDVRSKGYFSKPKLFYFSNFMMVYCGFVLAFSLDSLIFSDYCKPWSKIYTTGDESDEYFKFMKQRIKSSQNSADVKIKKTKSVGLKDDEI